MSKDQPKPESELGRRGGMMKALDDNTFALLDLPAYLGGGQWEKASSEHLRRLRNKKLDDIKRIDYILKCREGIER